MVTANFKNIINRFLKILLSSTLIFNVILNITSGLLKWNNERVVKYIKSYKVKVVKRKNLTKTLFAEETASNGFLMALNIFNSKFEIKKQKKGINRPYFSSIKYLLIQ